MAVAGRGLGALTAMIGKSNLTALSGIFPDPLPPTFGRLAPPELVCLFAASEDLPWDAKAECARFLVLWPELAAEPCCCRSCCCCWSTACCCCRRRSCCCWSCCCRIASAAASCSSVKAFGPFGVRPLDLRCSSITTSACRVSLRNRPFVRRFAHARPAHKQHSTAVEVGWRPNPQHTRSPVFYYKALTTATREDWQVTKSSGLLLSLYKMLCLPALLSYCLTTPSYLRSSAITLRTPPSALSGQRGCAAEWRARIYSHQRPCFSQ